jgi:lipopolysaccharide/colanic/teichoic acid biosynthesis glycosyltransferase
LEVGFQIHDIKSLFKRKKRMNASGVIHSPDSFRMILERERARAERTGHIFSLVIFSFNHGKGTDAVMLEQLGTVLVQKVRMSDELGWYDEGKSIGTLLPGTTANGAAQFIEILREKIGEEVESRLVSTVYTYPYPLDATDGCKEAAEERDTRSKSMASLFATANSSPMTPSPGTTARPLEVLYARPFPLWKRAIDFFGALLFLFLLSPLFLLVALFIKVVSPGPVLYRQQRIGYMRKTFTFWKFRTMHVHSDTEKHRQHLRYLIETDTPMIKLDDGNDNRIIPFGKFLRYSCIDELPQLINVLKGDMSLVGPRPCLPYEAEKYLHWHARRFDTMPGMTGLWQVSGKNRMTFKEMIRLDIRYSRTMSLLLDTKILFLTGPAVLGMVSEPLARITAREKETATFAPSRKEQSVRG